MRDDPKIEIIRDKDGTETFWMKIKDAEPDEVDQVKAHYDALERLAKSPDRLDKLEKEIQELHHVIAYLIDAVKYHMRNSVDIGQEKLDIATKRFLKLLEDKYREPEDLKES